jgi:polyhydroxyalkanoate synthesis regulator phasin
VNPLIVTIIIALATFILAIFGTSWLNQQAMNKRIDDLKTYLDARFGAVEQTMNAEFKTVRAGIETVRSEVAGLGNRVDRIERQLDQIFKPSLPRA